MKRRTASMFRKAAFSRVPLSLAIFSLTLVGFSAIAYAVSIPAVFEHAYVVAPLSDAPAGTPSSEPASAEAVPDAVSGDAEDPISTHGCFSSGFTSLMGSPAFSSLQTIVDEREDNPVDPMPSYPAPEPEMPSQPDGLSEEVEADIHAHLVACYADLQSYYEEVCLGYERLYSTMYSDDPNRTHVSCAPTDAYALLVKCDQGRIRVWSYRLNGESVLAKSKWHSEAQKLGTCFNDLTNACSAMRTVSGFTVKNAPGILAPHLNSNGEVRYLCECRERAATIRL